MRITRLPAMPSAYVHTWQSAVGVMVERDCSSIAPIDNPSTRADQQSYSQNINPAARFPIALSTPPAARCSLDIQRRSDRTLGIV
jgi:hypothetical protein